jgi:CubicO group peptidase (beta-lactamase class C family)
MISSKHSKKYFIGFALSLLAIQVQAQINPNANYHAPVFLDSLRTEKIKAVAPVIKKMYSDFATVNHIPGYAFGIVVDGKLVCSGSDGYTDVHNKIPATTQSMFRIASMSKSFTAMAIIQLRDAGKLQLDEPVSTYIPALKNQGLTKDAAEITIRQLLTHSAGFPEDNPWGDRQLADTEEELIHLFNKGISFSNVNGTTYEYSNVGFATLGYIIKKVSGVPYSEYIREHIWKPLGIHAAWEYSTIPINLLAKGYRWINNNWTEEIPLHDGIYGAMGGMITSVESFSKYMALHQNAWPARNDAENNIIKRSSIREMHQPWRFNALNSSFKYADGRVCPTATGYGYGLAILRDCDNKLMVGHSGGLPGFGSNWRILPDYGIGVVFLANKTYAPAAAINLSVLEHLISLAKLTPINIGVSAILSKRRNELVTLLPHFNEAATSGIFAENFFADYLIQSIRAEAEAIFNESGKILSVEEVVPENQLRGYFIMHGEKGNIKISFTLTPENPGLIQAYHISLLQ